MNLHRIFLKRCLIFCGLAGYLTMLHGRIYYMSNETTDIFLRAPQSKANCPQGPGSVPPIYVDVRPDETTSGNCVLRHYSQKSLPLTALASSPGSGNTWTRQLLEQLTGIYTGSVYCRDIDNRHRLGFLGECITNGSVVVVKTHKKPGIDNINFQRAILVLRNPYQSVLAEFNRKNRPNNNEIPGLAPLEMFYTQNWPRFVKRYSQDWVDMNTAWLNSSMCLHVLNYAALIEDTERELQELAKFLDLRFTTGDGHLKCIASDFRGNVKRPPRVLPSDIWTESVNRTLDAAIEKVRTVLFHQQGQL